MASKTGNNTVLEDIEAAPIEALLDEQGALRGKVQQWHVAAAVARMQGDHLAELLNMMRASECEGRLSRMFAEGCLKNLISIRRELYQYVEDRVSGEEARLPALMSEVYAVLEAHNKAAEKRLKAGDFMSREDRNRICVEALERVTEIPPVPPFAKGGGGGILAKGRAHSAGDL